VERTLKEWFEYYEKHNRLPDGFNSAGHYPVGAALYWDKNKGYTVLIRDEETKMMVMWETCGDLKYWVEFAKNAARDFNYETVGSRVGRNILAYLRALGVAIVKIHTNEDGLSRYICKDKDNNLVIASEGKMVNANTPNEIDDKPLTAHIITLYFNRKVEV